MISEKQLYLLIQLLKEKKERVKDVQRRHNLTVIYKFLNKLHDNGIQDIIDKIKT